jgi:hypothetical protein
MKGHDCCESVVGDFSRQVTKLRRAKQVRKKRYVVNVHAIQILKTLVALFVRNKNPDQRETIPIRVMVFGYPTIDWVPKRCTRKQPGLVHKPWVFA